MIHEWAEIRVELSKSPSLNQNNYTHLKAVLETILDHLIDQEETLDWLATTFGMHQHQLQWPQSFPFLTEKPVYAASPQPTTENSTRDKGWAAPEPEATTPLTQESSQSDREERQSGPVEPALKCAHPLQYLEIAGVVWKPETPAKTWREGAVPSIKLRCTRCGALWLCAATPAPAADPIPSTSPKQDKQLSAAELETTAELVSAMQAVSQALHEIIG